MKHMHCDKIDITLLHFETGPCWYLVAFVMILANHNGQNRHFQHGPIWLTYTFKFWNHLVLVSNTGITSRDPIEDEVSPGMHNLVSFLVGGNSPCWLHGHSVSLSSPGHLSSCRPLNCNRHGVHSLKIGTWSLLLLRNLWLNFKRKGTRGPFH